jgi:hypothetical protein
MGLRYAAHVRGLKIRLALGERDYINIITLARGEIMLRMVKLRGGAVKSNACRRWLNHFAAQSGEWGASSLPSTL